MEQMYENLSLFSVYLTVLLLVGNSLVCIFQLIYSMNENLFNRPTNKS